MYIYDHLGQKHKSWVIEAVNTLQKLKRESGSKPWPVIDECFRIWEKTRQEEYNSHLIYLQDIKQTRKDSKYASSYDKGNSELAGTGMTLRYTIDIPQQVLYMIRAVYDDQELPMSGKHGREFWIEFARRYPKYRIAEKV